MTPTSTEIYDPEAGTWGLSANLNQGRFSQSAPIGTLLKDCRGVFVAGGHITNTVSATNTAEIYGPLYVSVTIDIKPGEEPNSINLGSNGNVPVAIFITEEFDSTQFDPASVTLAGATVKLKGKTDLFVTMEEDVNNDGLMDLLVHIDTVALQLGHVVIDEAAWIPVVDSLWMAIVPTISTRREYRLSVVSTPGPRAGMFHRL